MLINTNFDLSSSVLRANKSSTIAIMQDHRQKAASAAAAVVGAPALLQTRPATDFSIEAIMGRNHSIEPEHNSRPSPQLASTAENSPSPETSAKGRCRCNLIYYALLRPYIHRMLFSGSQIECELPCIRN